MVMRLMKTSEAIKLAGPDKLIFLGARGSSRKTAPTRRTLVTVDQRAKGVVHWRTPDDKPFDMTRTGTPVWVEEYVPEVPVERVIIRTREEFKNFDYTYAASIHDPEDCEPPMVGSVAGVRLGSHGFWPEDHGEITELHVILRRGNVEGVVNLSTLLGWAAGHE